MRDATTGHALASELNRDAPMRSPPPEALRAVVPTGHLLRVVTAARATANEVLRRVAKAEAAMVIRGAPACGVVLTGLLPRVVKAEAAMASVEAATRSPPPETLSGVVPTDRLLRGVAKAEGVMASVEALTRGRAPMGRHTMRSPPPETLHRAAKAEAATESKDVLACGALRTGHHILRVVKAERATANVEATTRSPPPETLSGVVLMHRHATLPTAANSVAAMATAAAVTRSPPIEALGGVVPTGLLPRREVEPGDAMSSEAPTDLLHRHAVKAVDVSRGLLTVDLATVDLATVDLATVDLATVDRVTVDRVTEDQANSVFGTALPLSGRIPPRSVPARAATMGRAKTIFRVEFCSRGGVNLHLCTGVSI